MLWSASSHIIFQDILIDTAHISPYGEIWIHNREFNTYFEYLEKIYTRSECLPTVILLKDERSVFFLGKMTAFQCLKVWNKCGEGIKEKILNPMLPLWILFLWKLGCFFPVWHWFTFIPILFLIVRLWSSSLRMFFGHLISILGEFD